MEGRKEERMMVLDNDDNGKKEELIWTWKRKGKNNDRVRERPID
jgi:hypothetical protein